MCLKFDLKYALQDQDVINLEYCHQLEQPAQIVALQQLALFRLSPSIGTVGGDKISSFHRHSGVRQASNICLGKPQIPPSGDR